MKKVICIIALLIFAISIVSCKVSNIETYQTDNQTHRQESTATEKETEPSEKSDTELLREWIEYAEGIREYDLNTYDWFYPIETMSTEENIAPEAAYNYIYSTTKDKRFPESLDEEMKTYADLNAVISKKPTVMLDREIFPQANGEYTYVLFNLIDLKGHYAIATRKINSIHVEDGVLKVSVNIYCSPEDRRTNYDASMLLIKFKTEDLPTEMSSLEVVADISRFNLVITEPGECDDFRPFPRDDAYVPYIESVFNHKVETGVWSDDLTFECVFEFNDRSVLVNFTDRIFSEDKKIYALDDKVADFIFAVTKEPVYAKPVIYLYPEKDTRCSVELDFDGKLTCTYPNYSDGWNDFIAKSNGTLVFPDGREYYCLYWEGRSSNMIPDLTKGFCVKGKDTAEFLEWALTELGLNSREANEFMIFWLPILQENEYNVITFQTDSYADVAKLNITPTPDAMLRAYMYAYSSDEYVDIAPQTFEPFERTGFTVVEWGGTFIEN